MHDTPILTAHQCIKDNNLLSPGMTIILGLSGGPDSVFLLHVLVQLKETYNLTIIAAHLDHGWRENSEEDRDFCKTLADKLGIKFVSCHARDIVINKKVNGSREEHARNLRRQFFESTALQYNAHAIALAHHQDDQHETFFIRLLRGTGITGLAGMRLQHGLYIRPLLPITKKDILEYLTNNNINYLTDPTNTSDLFLRNKIRNSVVPTLLTCDSRFTASLERTLENLQETDLFLKELTTKTFNTVTTTQDNQLLLDIKAFLELDPFLQKRVLLEWLCTVQVFFTPSSSFFYEILRFLKESSSITHTMHSSWSILKDKKTAQIKKH